MKDEQSKGVKLTRELAWAAGQDAANARMRKEGRTKWNAADYALACCTFRELWGEERDVQ
jgi:hypothetical protein